MRALVFATMLALASPSVAGEPAPWRAVDAETGQIRDVDGLEKLAQDFPDSGNVRLRLLQPYLEAGETEKLLETLRWLKERGYVFGEVPQQQIPKLIGEDRAAAAQALLIPQAEVIASSEVVATAPAEAGLVESVFSPGVENVFLVTSVTEQALYGSDPDGNWQLMRIPAANDLSGIVSDNARNIGWIASGNIDGSEEGETLFRGLIGLVDGLNDAMRIAAPDGVHPSDLTIGPDSTLYTSDPLGGGIYRARPDAEELEALIAPGTFRSPQGLAVSDDNTKLYVSDYRYGMAIIDLATREVSRLAIDIPVILDGVDGMWRRGNELIAVQNGTSPMRISAFQLSDDGMRVVGHRILEQANPAWTEPLSGSLDGDALIYVGNGQWDLYIDGKLADGKEAVPTEIRRLPLD